MAETKVQKKRLTAGQVQVFIKEEGLNITKFKLKPHGLFRYDTPKNIPGKKFPYFILAGKKYYFKHPSLNTNWDLTDNQIQALFADKNGNFDANKAYYFEENTAVKSTTPASKKK